VQHDILWPAEGFVRCTAKSEIYLTEGPTFLPIIAALNAVLLRLHETCPLSALSRAWLSASCVHGGSAAVQVVSPRTQTGGSTLVPTAVVVVVSLACSCPRGGATCIGSGRRLAGRAELLRLTIATLPSCQQASNDQLYFTANGKAYTRT